MREDSYPWGHQSPRSFTRPARCCCRVAGIVGNPGCECHVLSCRWSRAAWGNAGLLPQMSEQAERPVSAPWARFSGGTGSGVTVRGGGMGTGGFSVPGSLSHGSLLPRKLSFLSRALIPFQGGRKKERGKKLRISSLLTPTHHPAWE